MTHTPEAIFATRMRQHRERLGWSQSKLADWMRTAGVDLHRSAITHIESGDRHIRLNEADAVAKALGVQLADLLTPVSCASCNDAPPEGFACLKCGAP